MLACCWRGVVSLGCVVLVSSAACQRPTAEVGFWFERVAFDSVRLGGAITAGELATIEAVATSELVAAFDGLPIHFSKRRNTRYHVRVVQELQDPRFLRRVGSAGQSRIVDGFGGSGAVSFFFLASGAAAYAPPNASRSEIVFAIGRGIGRTAVHEVTHQLLPGTQIHESTNQRSYEYASAARPQHYYGEMEWDFARPLLERRLGRSSS